MRFWNRDHKKEARIIKMRADRVNALAFNRDGSLLATGERQSSRNLLAGQGMRGMGNELCHSR